MSPKGRVPTDNDERAGHRKGVGESEAIEVLPVDGSLTSIDPPTELSQVAAEIWTVCLADMAKLGHLREPDLLLLRGYCEIAGVMVEAAACIREHGSMMSDPVIIQDSVTGEGIIAAHRLSPNPAVKQHREAVNALRLLSNELALNPLARIRGNLLEAATSSIALSVLSELEAKLDRLDAQEAAKAAQPAKAAPRKAPAKKPVAKKASKAPAARKR